MDVIKNESRFYGVGADIVSVHRFEGWIDEESFLNKIFTEREIDYCKSKVRPCESFAGIFAGKEAIIKALNRFHNGLKLTDIEIVHDAERRPKVNILDDIFDIDVSLSHDRDYALAFAIAQQKLEKGGGCD